MTNYSQFTQNAKRRFTVHKFRCSQLYRLMTEPRSKSEVFGETAKDYLIECHYSKKHNRDKDIQTKEMDKGIECEEDSITLISQLDAKFYLKNEMNYSNEYITGTPDIVTFDRIQDVKTSWDYFTFIKNHKEIEAPKVYYWQMQGYLMLTGLELAQVRFCLVNTPKELQDKEARWNNRFNPRLHNFDDIPIEERVITFDVKKDVIAFEKIIEKSILGNKWISDNLK